GQDSRWLFQARGQTFGKGDADLPADRPAHPPAVSRRVLQRSAGGCAGLVVQSRSRSGHSGIDRGLGGPHYFRDSVQRPDRGRARRPHQRRIRAQPYRDSAQGKPAQPRGRGYRARRADGGIGGAPAARGSDVGVGAEGGPEANAVKDICFALESKIVRNQILDGEARIDGRDTRTVRPISARVGVLPRTHGSALFTRGETQALVVATLGTGRDEQIIDALMGEYTERFMLHYNMPPYATGETGRMGSPKRREIGHGRLAKRAL